MKKPTLEETLGNIFRHLCENRSALALKHSTWRTLAIIVHMETVDATCSTRRRVTVDRVVAASGVSESSVWRSLKELERGMYVRVSRGSWGDATCVYARQVGTWGCPDKTARHNRAA